MVVNSLSPNMSKEDALKFHSEIIEKEAIVPDKIYAELSLFRDLRVGALLTTIIDKSPEEGRALYEQAQQCIPEYQLRTSNDTVAYFPHFGMTNADIDRRLQTEDPELLYRLMVGSPPTHFVRTFECQIGVNANHSTAIGKKTPITLYLNTYPLKVSRASWQYIGEYFARRFGIRVVHLYAPLNEIPSSILRKCDEYYTNNIQAFMENSRLQSMMTNMKCARKHLFATMLFGDKVHTEAELKDIRTQVHATKMYLDMLVRLFTWIPTSTLALNIMQLPEVKKYAEEQEDLRKSMQ